MSAARSARDDRHRGRMAALQLLYQREVGGAAGAELDEALRARAAARAATARSADRRLSALNCALRAVRNELNRSNSGNDRF